MDHIIQSNHDSKSSLQQYPLKCSKHCVKPLWQAYRLWYCQYIFDQSDNADKQYSFQFYKHTEFQIHIFISNVIHSTKL